MLFFIFRPTQIYNILYIYLLIHEVRIVICDFNTRSIFVT